MEKLNGYYYAKVDDSIEYSNLKAIIRRYYALNYSFTF
jgi:hypothetical protein